ncbi:MAG: caspase family protein, partial [Bacteroidota bacterium]
MYQDQFYRKSKAASQGLESTMAIMRGIGSALCLLLSFALFGQQNRTLHLIYNINDHQQDGIFQGCQKDRSSAKEVFGVVGEVARQPGSGFSLVEHPVSFDKASVESLLNSMSLQTDDAVIFLYSGHGLKNQGNNRWPLLYYCMEAEAGQHDRMGCELSLKWVHEQLKAKNIRMSITLGSSCNNDPFGEANVEQLRRELAEHGSNSQPEGVAHYNFDLITKFEGHILASASSPGQVAFLNDAIGSYYVAAFLNVLVDGLIAEQPTTWASIF